MVMLTAAGLSFNIGLPINTNLYSPQKTVVTQKTQQRKHKYKQSENNDQVHHSS